MEKSKISLPVLVMTLMAMLLVPLTSYAGSNDELRQYVVDNTHVLMSKLETNKTVYHTDPDKFYQVMEESLGNFVDFRRIAARVMGRYARQATPEQRHAFLEKFKHSLFDSYAKALVDAKDYQINVKDVIPNPRDDSRAQVNLEVVSGSGNRYPITYSMYRNDQGKWVLENIIVEGVNIGLAFRDRFEQDMEKQRGNVQAVIDNWSGAVKQLDEKHPSQGSATGQS